MSRPLPRYRRGGDSLTRVIDTLRGVERDRGAYVVDKRIVDAFDELLVALRARGFHIIEDAEHE